MRCFDFANEHQVQSTFVLFPTGTVYRGTPKHDCVGKVHTNSLAHQMLACGRGGIHPQPERAGPSAAEMEVSGAGRGGHCISLR